MGLRKCAALVGDASVLAWQFDACRRRLEENRFVAGQNIPAESGRANDPFGQLPELIEDQAKRNVTIISVGGSPAVQADKMAASPALVVFTSGDPIQISTPSAADCFGWITLRHPVSQ
jgi:hypothetical protein